MTPGQDRRAALVADETWHRTPAYADLLVALAEYGYASYAEARRLRLAARTDAEKARWQAMHEDWSARMVARVGLSREGGTSKTHGKRSHVQRRNATGGA